MSKVIWTSIGAAAALGLAACSQPAENNVDTMNVEELNTTEDLNMDMGNMDMNADMNAMDNAADSTVNTTTNTGY